MSPPVVAERHTALRKLLMVAFHFPPLAGSSGIQRTLRFAQYLPAYGWEPLVLTVRPSAYERTSEDLLAEIPTGIVVERAFGLDTARHLSIRGRYVGAMARPDRWVSWRFDGVRRGLAMIRAHRPSAIWSTYPVATAHLIGAALQKRSGLPWVADFRDPMAQDGYPADPITWRQYKDIEANAMCQARASTFTTPSAVREYGRRYPACVDRCEVLENGYDEDSFATAPDDLSPLVSGATVLLHSGIVYPSERDPTQLMEALRRLVDAGTIARGRLRVRFRAAVAEDLLRDLARRWGVEDCVEILPPLPYREALIEMLRADGLLVLQATNCNAQIPAKIYEYLRARRPIVCLTDPAGDTASVLRAAGVARMARLDDAGEIATLLSEWTAGRSDGFRPGEHAIAAASRQGRTRQFAALLDRIAG